MAYTAIMEGRTQEAKHLLGSSSYSYMTNFLQACLELSEGNLYIAQFYANQLILINKEIPDGRVLLELIKRRKSFPEERWINSFAEAWKKVGSPKLNLLNTIVMGEWEEDVDKIECKEIDRTIQGTPDELLQRFEYGYCNYKEFIELCITHSTPETPLEIRLLAFEFLKWVDYDDGECSNFKVSDDLRRRANKRRLELIQQFSSELPLYSKFEIMKILNQASIKENFSLSDIEHLEKALARPHLAPIRYDLYEWYLSRYNSIGSKNPRLMASSIVSLLDGNVFSFDLKKKAKITAENASPEVKKKLADILKKLGKAHLQRRTLIDLIIGSNILRTSIEIRGDKHTEEQLEKLFIFSKGLVNHSAYGASYLWPIQPLMVDSIELQMNDELALYQLLSGKNKLSEILDIIIKTK